jgi:DNA-binding XRE family transcriptional regulator
MTVKRPTLKDFRNKILNDPESKALYEELKLEYQLLEELIAARQASGLTQEQVADKMGTRKSNISRLENNLFQKPSPTLATLKKYAQALGCHLEIHVVPNQA